MVTKPRSISTDAHFAAIIASSDDAIISKGLDSVIHSWNQAAERIFVYDVTDRLRDQARLAEAEDQLRQAQKMEAVGQLTGGVAHDFNNMLAVVSGSLELLDRRISSEDAQARTLISSALEATRRAGNLTQRLLAFSRRQPLKPQGDRSE